MTREEAFEYLLGRAAEMGLDVEALGDEERELSIDASDGDISELKQASRGGVGVRAVTEGRVGYAWSEELTPEALDWVLAEARENALLQDETEGFLPQATALGRKDLLSEGLSAPLEEKVARAIDFENRLRRDERYSKTQTARYLEQETVRAISSTAGASGEYRNGVSGLMASFVMRDGESVKQGNHLDAKKEFHSLDPGRTAQEMLHKTGRLLGARSLATGRYRAYLEPPVVGQFLRVIQHALSGKTLIEGQSPLEGKLGQKIAAEAVTLVDDPNHPEGLGNRPFDSEGTPGRRITLIERGVLRSFLHNSHTASRSGHENTGHGRRSYRGTLGVSPSNLLLLPGDGVEPDDGVIVTELMGLHAGANPISGDFSLQGLGLKVEGDTSYPVENFVISGNLYKVLLAVTGLGRESEWDPLTNVNAPMVEIESLSFGGA